MDNISKEQQKKNEIENTLKQISSDVFGCSFAIRLGAGRYKKTYSYGNKILNDYYWWNATICEQFVDACFKAVIPPINGLFRIALSPNRIVMDDVYAITKKTYNNSLELKTQEINAKFHYMGVRGHSLRKENVLPANIDLNTGNIHKCKRENWNSPIKQISIGNEKGVRIRTPIEGRESIEIITDIEGYNKIYIPKDKYFPRIEDKEKYEDATVEMLLVGFLNQILNSEYRKKLHSKYKGKPKFKQLIEKLTLK